MPKVGQDSLGEGPALHCSCYSKMATSVSLQPRNSTVHWVTNTLLVTSKSQAGYVLAAPERWWSAFTQAVACYTAEAHTSYSLRNKLGLSASRLRSFLPSVIPLWNSLPTEVSSCKSLSSFLCHLDKFYVSDRFSFGLS